MKRLALLLSVLLIGLMGYSQMFKPLSKVVPYEIKSKGISPVEGDVILPSVWLPRIAASVSALSVNLSEKGAISKPLSALGFGCSYGKYVVANDKPYCMFSINALLITQIKVGEEYSPKLGGAVTFDVLNKFIGLGVGYVDKSALLLINVSLPL